MRYFTKENELKFFKVPTTFDKYSPKNILQYAIGANMYVPGTITAIYEKLIENKFYNIGALTLCLEDSIEDNKVQEAQKNILNLLDSLYKFSLENKIYDLPLIFIRVRNVEQFYEFSKEFNKEQLSVLCGFSFPKFNSDNGLSYLSIFDELVKQYQEVLYAMPIIEDNRVMYKEHRLNELIEIQKVLKIYEDYILNIRVGGTDFSSLFGLRRDVTTTIYDIKVVVDCITDIINVFMRQDNQYVLSGPVWEYYAWDENSLEIRGLKKELLLDIQNGFYGKTIIHPSQIDIVNKAYVVKYTEYQDAVNIIESKGGVFASYNGNSMNEVNPHRQWAKKILARSEVFGVINVNTEI